jgi:hypothetical protein
VLFHPRSTHNATNNVNNNKLVLQYEVWSNFESKKQKTTTHKKTAMWCVCARRGCGCGCVFWLWLGVWGAGAWRAHVRVGLQRRSRAVDEEGYKLRTVYNIFNRYNILEASFIHKSNTIQIESCSLGSPTSSTITTILKDQWLLAQLSAPQGGFTLLLLLLLLRYNISKRSYSNIY